MQQQGRHAMVDHLEPLVGAGETEATPPDIPDGIAILGCGDSGESGPSSDADGGCAMHYFDERGVSRVYRFDAEKGQWRFWRDRPGFSQRYACTVSEDGNTMVESGELSRDGSTWEPDLRVTYRRVG